MDSAWKYAMDLLVQNPNVLAVTRPKSLLDLLVGRNQTLKLIYRGLRVYAEEKRLIFKR